eukprot:TRINITY_DN12905_c0_g1_i2.p1 TRINITY_DN12905_c0_g1~~TRINITY_DN12905_c0_g1_i2.p1  ORF type:complete len:403 (+),score=58.11 TRINITY_DN12905_c0_g1_i2:156-1364(+)
MRASRSAPLLNPLSPPTSPTSPGAHPFRNDNGQLKLGRSISPHWQVHIPNGKATPSGIGDLPPLVSGFFASAKKSRPKSSSAKSASAKAETEAPGTRARVRAQPKRASRKHDRVPLSLRDMDLLKGTELFKIYDMSTGSVNRTRFYNLLKHAVALQGYKEVITKADSDSYFDEIDIDMSETIEQDEFLSWLFRTDANYCTAMRRRLNHMDEREVLRCHQQMDTNGNGLLDKDEFYLFVQKFADDLSRETVDGLFRYIDADGSGEVSTMELLDWVHPTRIKGSRGRTGVFEARPSKPVVLVFHVGDQYSKTTMPAISSFLASRFSPDKLQIECRVEPGIDTCTRVVAAVGRGVVLWDRLQMMQHRDDPFQGRKHVAMFWLQGILEEMVPHLMVALPSESKACT